MPTVRYQIRNEYGLADPEVYWAADKDDPEALLEGVAMAGLVGALRQLGDLAEFAAEVFHDLHEEVMATSARGHGVMLRVQQLEAEFPSIEKALLSQADHSSCAYSAGNNWHANIRVDQNSVTQGDMPHFILDSYEECRGPPRLFMLDKFDVAGAGACLTRYSDPSFFKTASASEMMESELQREKRARKLKKKGTGRRSGEMAESFFTPIIANSHHIAAESVPEKFPARCVRLKHRNLRSSDISNRKSYMECFLEKELLEQNDLRSSLSSSHIKTSIDWDSEVKEVLLSSATDSSLVRKEGYPPSPKEEVYAKLENQKAEGREFAETISVLSGGSQQLYPNSQNAKQEAVQVGLGNRMGKHAFELRSDENDTNNLFADSGLITDDGHGAYESDDIGSVENYVDALNTMESEIENDSESRVKSDAGLVNSESRGTNPGINGHLELQLEFPGSGFVESFDTSRYAEKMKDGTPILSQSTTLVELHYPQLHKRTVAEATSCLEINQVVTGELERTGEALELILSAYSTFNGTCYEQQLNATMLTPISEEASSNSFITDLALNPKQNFEEAQSLTIPSTEAFFGYTESAPDVNQSIEFSFLPWKTNHVVFPAYKEHPDIPSDIIEESNLTEHSEDRILATITDKDDMSCDISEAEHGILPEKDPAEYLKSSPLTMMCDEIGKPLEMLEHDTNDCISGSISPSIPMGTFAWEPPYLSNELKIYMQSEDLAKKTSSKYIDGSDEASKQLDSRLQFPAETHELPLIGSNNIVSHESTQNSTNVYDDLEHLSDERGSPHGSRDYSMKDEFSGDTEKITANDMASIFQISELPQMPAESSSQVVCTVYVKDSLHNSMEKENETYSVEKLSSTSSAFSLEIVSSILQSESLDVETRNISTTEEELLLPQSPASSENVDIVEQKTSIFPYITNEFEYLSDAEEPQQFANICTGELPPSDCGEDHGVNPLQPVVSELIETNGKEQSIYALELANGSTKLILQFDQLQLEESAKEDDSLAGNVITEDCMDVQVLHMLQSAKVSSFDVHLQEDPILEKDTYNSRPSIEEPAITRDSTSLQPENKSVMPFAQNKDLEIFVNTVSRTHSSVLDLSNSSDAKLVGLNVDNLRAEFPPCWIENEHGSYLEFENFITEDVLSLLQSSNVYSLDVPLQKGAFSEDASLNQCKPDVEELDTADSESKSENVITEDGTDGQVLSLLQSSYVSSFHAQFQEDSASEDASLNQPMPEIEEPAMKNELTSLKFASKLFAPLTKNGDQEESVSAISSSQLLALGSFNFTDDQLADDTFDDIHMELDHGIYEENFMCSREDEQDTNSKASVLHFQADAERPEVQSEQASVANAVDKPSTTYLHGGGVNIEPSDTHFYEVCSDERTNIQNNLELEVLLPEPEHETLIKHGRNNELNMPSSKTDKREEIKTDPSVVSTCVFEHTGSFSASETLASGSPFVADFIIPTSITSIEEPLPAFPGEVVSSSQLQKDVAEAPPLPPLPPLQWRMGKPQLGYLIAGEHMTCVMDTNPLTLPSNAGSMHINFSPPSKDEIDQRTIPFLSLSALEERVQHVSISTDGHMTQEWSELPPITMDQRQELEIQFPDFKTFQSSNLSLIVPSKEDVKRLHGNIATEAENLFTIAPSLKDVNLQRPDLFEERKPQAIEESRPKLVKLLPGLELERSQEAPVMDGDAALALSSFLFMPTAGDSKYQYAYEDYEGENMQHHNLSAPFPVAVHRVPHYGYMFLREGDSSIYDIILPEMEDDKLTGKPLSIRNRPRDPLIEAVATHDKSTLRKVSELDWPSTKPAEDERNYLLEQIKNRSFNLKPVAAAKANLIKAPSTNLKVAAILEKANAIRQACVGSDEDDDDNWSDS